MTEEEKEKRRRMMVLSAFDEITERLNRGESINLNTFAPDAMRRERKNAAILKSIENRRKL